jgi:hypothetical protein
VGLFFRHHSLVELKLTAFQDNTITSTGLSWARGDLGKQTARGHLVVKGGFQSAVALSGLELGSNLFGNLGKIDRRLSSLGSGGFLHSTADTIMSLIILLERVGINKDDRTLDQGLGPDQFVIGCIVCDIQNSDLACAHLGSPGEVSGIELESACLDVSSSATDLVDACIANLGHRRGASQFELSLLSELGTATSGLATLVCSFTSDTL